MWPRPQEIGQATFIEVIKVSPNRTPTCVPNVRLGVSKWQNPVNRFDVNNDGIVSQADYDIVKSYIDTNGAGKLPKGKPSSAPFVDISGDGYVTTRDLSQLAEFLSTGKANDTTLETCYNVNSFDIERDLLDPTRASTVRRAAVLNGVLPTSDYSAYLRDYITQAYTEIGYGDPVKTKDSLCFIHNDLINCPVCGPNPGSPGCDRLPCIFRLLTNRLRCDLACVPHAVKDPNCARQNLTPSRYIPGYDRNPCDVPFIVTPPLTPPLPSLSRTVIIAIYDEAEDFYANDSRTISLKYGGTAESRYASDKAEWENLVKSLDRAGDIKVRMGMIQPTHMNSSTNQPWPLLCDTCTYPRDSDRSVIDHILLPLSLEGSIQRIPRVFADEIVDMFNTIIENGSYDPTFLIFLLDNSGSVLVSEYASELGAAKARLIIDYPNMIILEDLVTAQPERWALAAAEAMNRVIAQFGSISTV